jgi:hypothetical protein
MNCAGIMAANGMSSSSIHNSTGVASGPGVSPRGGPTDASASNAKRILYAEFDSITLDDNTTGQGNEAVQDAVGFSFRKSLEHYKISDDFRVVEARWQQMYRVFSVNSAEWDEPQVDAPDGTPTRPHPGYDAWDQSDHYAYADPSSSKNVDYQKGQARTRDQQSEEGPTLTDATLKAEYVINVQETS